jgi:hypothetical protein
MRDADIVAARDDSGPARHVASARGSNVAFGAGRRSVVQGEKPGFPRKGDDGALIKAAAFLSGSESRSAREAKFVSTDEEGSPATLAQGSTGMTLVSFLGSAKRFRRSPCNFQGIPAN